MVKAPTSAAASCEPSITIYEPNAAKAQLPDDIGRFIYGTKEGTLPRKGGNLMRNDTGGDYVLNKAGIDPPPAFDKGYIDFKLQDTELPAGGAHPALGNYARKNRRMRPSSNMHYNYQTGGDGEEDKRQAILTNCRFRVGADKRQAKTDTLGNSATLQNSAKSWMTSSSCDFKAERHNPIFVDRAPRGKDQHHTEKMW